MNWIPVLELSGGGWRILLEGRQDVLGLWFFRFRPDEYPIANICSFDAAKGSAPPTGTVKGLDAALEKLGERYKSWTSLYPELLHDEFALEICRSALRTRHFSHRWKEIAESLYFMFEPIATQPEFEQALLSLREDGALTDSHIRLLTTQCRALNSTITATLLAKAAGQRSYRWANLHYGELGHLVAIRLGYSPPSGPKGTPLYWTTLAYSERKSPGEFAFIMRPELVKALKSTGLVKPLQNRVLPTGEIVAFSSVGTLMGNRGASAKLHSSGKELTSQHHPMKIDWKFCTLKAKDRSGNNIQRELMGKSYTELFFLDEATAFSAGHRPCTCMGNKQSEFIKRWSAKNGTVRWISEIDEVIAKERLDADGKKITFETSADRLPDGTLVKYHTNTYLVWKGLLLEWSPDGYISSIPLPAGQQVTVLTPRSIVNCFGPDYTPEVHLSSQWITAADALRGAVE